MFDTLEVVQPQQKQATPVRPATDRQVEVLVNLGLCATPDEARKLTSVQASEQLTNREIGINTESAGGLAIRANNMGVKTHPVGRKTNGRPLFHEAETRRNMQLALYVVKTVQAMGNEDADTEALLKHLVLAVGKTTLTRQALIDLLATLSGEESKGKLAQIVDGFQLPRITNDDASDTEV